VPRLCNLLIRHITAPAPLVDQGARFQCFFNPERMKLLPQICGERVRIHRAIDGNSINRAG
jgi:hypothetical protein